MKIDYKYNLDKAEARARLEVLGEYLHNRHGINVSWNGDTGRFTGKYLVVKIDGRLTIGDGVVNFDGEDPGMLWRKKAVKYLEDKMAEYLNPATPLASLPRSK